MNNASHKNSVWHLPHQALNDRGKTETCLIFFSTSLCFLPRLRIYSADDQSNSVSSACVQK